MNFIGLVKDSFEAVVSEVEAACHREPAGTPQRQDDCSSIGRSEATPPWGNDDAESDNCDASVDAPAETAANVSAEGVESEASEQPAEMSLPGQLQLLADVMQQASAQLSAAADDSSVEDKNENRPDPFEELQQGQAELRKLFDSRIHSDEVQSRTLERLHQELQASRQQIQRAEMAPLLKDVIFCHDFVTRELDRENSGEGHTDWRQAFEVLGQMLLDVLFKYDVEPFRGESEEFDRTLQQCVKTEVTSEQESDRRIATYGLTGFRNEDRIIRREQVTVYRYRPSG